MANPDDWKLTDTAFNKLLSCLSPNQDEAAKLYELLRQKLIRFWESNGVGCAEDPADEVINRVTRKIDQGASIPNVFAYAIGVAKMMLKEFWKERNRMSSVERQLPTTTAPVVLSGDDDDHDVRLRCFDLCSARLSTENLQLIMDYYREDRHAKIALRRELAEELGIELNALRIRAHRLRKNLEACVKECVTAAR